VKRRSTGYIALLTILSVLLLAGRAWALSSCVDDDCYEDIVVSGAGISICNGTYEFQGFIHDQCHFESASGMRLFVNASDGVWAIREGGYVYYTHSPTQEVIPPQTGWETGAFGDVPNPTVSRSRETGPAPTLTEVRLSTNPWTGSWVGLDKAITLRFYASKRLDTPAVTIMGHPVLVAVDHWAKSYWATYRPTEGDAEGPITFTIDYQDLSGRSGPRITEQHPMVEVHSGMDGPYVFDRTPPTVPWRIYPEDGQILAGTQVTLRWSESTDAMCDDLRYQVTIRSQDGSFEDDFSVGSDRTEMTYYRLEEGVYTWEVVALDRAGNVAASDEPGTFALDVPNGELILSKPGGTTPLVEGAECSNIINVGLSEAPTADVFVVLEWGNQISTEGPEPTTSLDLTLTPSNWEAIPVCLYAIDDDAYEGWHAATIWGLTVSTQYDFDALNASTSISITDNDPLFQGVTIGPAAESGNTLDIGIPEWMVPEGQDPPVMEGYVLSAAIEIGTPISGGVSILTAFGTPLVSTWGTTATLQQLLIEEGGHSLTEVSSQYVFYDILRGGFFFSFETDALEESLYLLTLEFEDGSAQDFLIELMAPMPGG
jgi:hypothetical protein